MKGKVSIDDIKDYDLFNLVKREHEKYETDKRARNIGHLLEEDYRKLKPEEIDRMLQNLFL